MELQLKNITKHYGRMKANSNISLNVRSGEIHGVLGENGAGKSTLMKILSGIVKKDAGEIIIDNQAVDFENPRHASSLGIGMLFQEPLDFPQLTVLENFMMGQGRGIFFNKGFYKKSLEKLAADFQFDLNANALVKSLTVGERQQLEILRLLSLGVSCLILDEPATGISSARKGIVFAALKKLASQGKSVLLVSHKLSDVQELCSRVTVLSRGRVAGEAAAPFKTQSLLDMMFEIRPIPPETTGSTLGKIVLEMRNISSRDGRTGLRHCTVSIRQGDVIGLAGIGGSGGETFLKTAAGLCKPAEGCVYLSGSKVRDFDHHKLRKKGVAYLPATRLEEGLIKGMTVAEHFAVRNEKRPFFGGMKKAREISESRIAEFRIKASPSTNVEELSGGNLQRLLLSLLPEKPILLLLDNPTRGLDMESAQSVWEHLHRHCKRNAAVLFTSSELDEIFTVASRIFVFHNGRLVKDAACDNQNISIAEIGEAIAKGC